MIFAHSWSFNGCFIVEKNWAFFSNLCLFCPYKKDEMLLFYMKWNVGWSSVQYSHSKGWRTVLASHHDYFFYFFSPLYRDTFWVIFLVLQLLNLIMQPQNVTRTKQNQKGEFWSCYVFQCKYWKFPNVLIK